MIETHEIKKIKFNKQVLFKKLKINKYQINVK